MMPPLSIITVCFNEAQRIELTCQSIVNQTFQQFEWIVIDGGSTDGTLDVLTRYAHRMNYFLSEPDRGIYHAMNKGIAQAHGAYLLFLNGGDYLHDSCVLEHVFTGRTLEKDVYYGDVLAERADGFKRRSFDFTNAYAMLTQRPLPHQATFIKHALFEQYGTHNESFTIGADFEFFLRVFVSSSMRKQHTIEHLPYIISVYENAQGISSRNIGVRDTEHRRARKAHYPASYLLFSQARIWYLRRKNRWMPHVKFAVKFLLRRLPLCRKSA